MILDGLCGPIAEAISAGRITYYKAQKIPAGWKMKAGPMCWERIEDGLTLNIRFDGSMIMSDGEAILEIAHSRGAPVTSAMEWIDEKIPPVKSP